MAGSFMLMCMSTCVKAEMPVPGNNRGNYSSQAICCVTPTDINQDGLLFDTNFVLSTLSHCWFRWPLSTPGYRCTSQRNLKRNFCFNVK